MVFKTLLTFDLMVTANAVFIKPTTFSTAASPFIFDIPTTLLANINFATIQISGKKKKKHHNSDDVEDINQKMSRVLDLALIAMSEERHIIPTDLEHYNPWDHIDEIYTKGFEHEDGMTVDRKRFYNQFGYQLRLLKRMKEEAKGPPPCTTIVVEIVGDKTTNVQCPTSTVIR